MLLSTLKVLFSLMFKVLFTVARVVYVMAFEGCVLIDPALILIN